MFSGQPQRNNRVRIGMVSSIVAEKALVRVKFEDNDSVSSELPVLFAQTVNGKYFSLPAVGERVLCLFLSDDASAGFCLGAFYTDANPPPPSAIHQQGVWFPDGSHVFYDATSGELHLKANSKVIIEGDLQVTGRVTEGGG
ncbi:phage baseplate assembly protein V [Paenibacillus sp. TAB 01]|uniref:phage baseplate assembly protein V n=1 Tax=Paenibacillus sp. TAB 01 TaxID=3368988 RepID=UPI0037535F85